MKRIALLLGLLLALGAPAQAAFAPVFTVYSSSYGTPGGNRIAFGTVTFGASDTYVTGGFTVTPAQIGFNQVITQIVFAFPNSSAGPYFTVSTGGNGTIKFNSLAPTSVSSTPTITSTAPAPAITSTAPAPVITSSSSTPTATIVTGESNVTAAGTTKTVTGLSGLTADTPIFCQLNDAATGGGGTGTWGVTVGISSCKFASSSSFTLTVTAAAPTNNGNFVYWIGLPPTISTPTITSSSAVPVITSSSAVPVITSTSSTPTITNTQAAAEMSSGASLASLAVPFVAIGY